MRNLPKLMLIGVAIVAACQSTTKAESSLDAAQQLARGKYMVTVGGCGDCHSPKVFTAAGPVFDTTRSLSGHPSHEVLPPMTKGALGQGRWSTAVNDGLTAWTGGWGTSFTANLTPHETGLKFWRPEDFIATMRTGKHMGTGRAILPPMPWQQIGQWTDTDLRAAFAYLQSLTPINNRVPPPQPPAAQ